MNNKKTIKFSVDEEHLDFEKTKIKPTKLFDIEDIEDNEYNEFNKLSSFDLKYKLDNEELNSKQIEIINKILASRQDE